MELTAEDFGGIAAILRRYEHRHLQLADAALVHLANRETIETIFTLDRRDFGVLRGERGKKFRLIP
jgi:predicted nucleic acid-binding protein